jgi:hypothetical protein
MPNGESGRVIDTENIRRKSKEFTQKILGNPKKLEFLLPKCEKYKLTHSNPPGSVQLSLVPFTHHLHRSLYVGCQLYSHLQQTAPCGIKYHMTKDLLAGWRNYFFSI